MTTKAGWQGRGFEGDTLYARSEVLEARESRSRPHMGIVRVHTTGFDQDGAVVIEFERALMVYRRGHAPNLARAPLAIVTVWAHTWRVEAGR
jgi:itaconyl-CoA hydratase